jgi:hypothetical protein
MDNLYLSGGIAKFVLRVRTLKRSIKDLKHFKETGS